MLFTAVTAQKMVNGKQVSDCLCCSKHVCLAAFEEVNVKPVRTALQTFGLGVTVIRWTGHPLYSHGWLSDNMKLSLIFCNQVVLTTISWITISVTQAAALALLRLVAGNSMIKHIAHNDCHGHKRSQSQTCYKFGLRGALNGGVSAWKLLAEQRLLYCCA